MARSAHPANPQRCRVPVSLPAPVPAALGSLRMIARPEKRREQSMSRDKEVPRLNTAIVNCQTDTHTCSFPPLRSCKAGLAMSFCLGRFNLRLLPFRDAYPAGPREPGVSFFPPISAGVSSAKQPSRYPAVVGISAQRGGTRNGEDGRSETELPLGGLGEMRGGEWLRTNLSIPPSSFLRFPAFLPSFPSHRTASAVVVVLAQHAIDDRVQYDNSLSRTTTGQSGLTAQESAWHGWHIFIGRLGSGYAETPPASSSNCSYESVKSRSRNGMGQAIGQAMGQAAGSGVELGSEQEMLPCWISRIILTANSTGEDCVSREIPTMVRTWEQYRRPGATGGLDLQRDAASAQTL
ncbi:unnamed protein product [Diplocarpon coronariae]